MHVAHRAVVRRVFVVRVTEYGYAMAGRLLINDKQVQRAWRTEYTQGRDRGSLIRAGHTQSAANVRQT